MRSPKYLRPLIKKLRSGYPSPEVLAEIASLEVELEASEAWDAESRRLGEEQRAVFISKGLWDDVKAGKQFSPAQIDAAPTLTPEEQARRYADRLSGRPSPSKTKPASLLTPEERERIIRATK